MTMTPAERKAELMRRGVTQTAIAERLGVHLSHVGHVVNDRRRSVAVEQAIAEAIGKPVKKVFPQVAA